jgi:D-alanine-D-alanine ligase
MDELSRKPRVGVLYGGISAERAVSLRSGEAVALALRQAGYPVELLDIRDVPLGELAGPRLDAAFNLLHGTFGEDGGIQSVLDVLHVPYTGSGACASHLAMDKAEAKSRFQAEGVPTPEGLVLEADWPEDRQIAAARSFGFPMVVKPVSNGSSVGVSVVTSEEHLGFALRKAFRHEERVLAEAFIDGRELTVGILDDRPLPIIELLYDASHFTYEVKYTPGAATHVISPRLPAGVAECVQEAALTAHRCLGCRGATRVDLRLGGDGQPMVLEINTIPGMTATSLLPDAARAVGISFPELCERILDEALTVGSRAEARRAVEV